MLTADDVEFVIEHYPEDIPIEGNASAIDEETDRETEQWIREQLKSGNEWAWCLVTVKACWKEFEGCDYLGGCSYDSEASFREGGYFEDMKEQALAGLNSKLTRVAHEIDVLRTRRHR